jgi:hypothetical protein
MWENIAEPDKPRMTIWRTRIACWIIKATDTHSEYVILIAFPRQQWLYEGASVLGYSYIACVVYQAV